MGWIADLLSEFPAAARYKIELEQLASEHEILKSENKSLKFDLDECEKERGNLNLLIQGLKEKDQKKYEAETEKVLLHFFNVGRDLSVNDFVSVLSGGISVIQYHFDLLLKDGLITMTRSGEKSSWTQTDEPDMYALTPDGREYVVKNIGT